jgi:hypothetical protein
MQNGERINIQERANWQHKGLTWVGESSSVIKLAWLGKAAPRWMDASQASNVRDDEQRRERTKVSPQQKLRELPNEQKDSRSV